MLRYTAAEMLKEWKLRKGYDIGRKDCTLVRDDGVDLDSFLMTEIKMRYERLLSDAPAEMVPVSDIADDCAVEIGNDLSARIILPSNCVRVLELKMPSWRNPVTEFAAPDSAIAIRQRSQWLRGGTENPVCIARHRCIDAYSVASPAETVPAAVLAVCRPEMSVFLFADRAWEYLTSDEPTLSR